MRHFEAADINASGAVGFPHGGQGNDRDGTRVSAIPAWSPMMAVHRKAARARKTTARKTTPKRWSQRVTRESDALDRKRGVFTLRDPKKIAASLKRSAEGSYRRKAGAYRSSL